jgi:hypothetical protein
LGELLLVVVGVEVADSTPKNGDVIMTVLTSGALAHQRDAYHDNTEQRNDADDKEHPGPDGLLHRRAVRRGTGSIIVRHSHLSTRILL